MELRLIIKRSTQAQHWISRLCRHRKVTSHIDPSAYVDEGKWFSLDVEETVSGLFEEQIDIYLDSDASLEEANSTGTVLEARVPVSVLKRIVAGAGL